MLRTSYICSSTNIQYSASPSTKIYLVEYIFLLSALPFFPSLEDEVEELGGYEYSFKAAVSDADCSAAV